MGHVCQGRSIHCKRAIPPRERIAKLPHGVWHKARRARIMPLGGSDMPAAVHLLLIAVAAVALFFALAPLVQAWWMSRGQRLATGPEPEEPAAAEPDPINEAFMAFLKTWE